MASGLIVFSPACVACKDSPQKRVLGEVLEVQGP